MTLTSESPAIPIAYHGTRSALTALFFKNLALSIVTLGVYRFWAITNLRAFLWGHWSVAGEPFDYSGTGKELFIGFLKVAVALMMLSTAAQIGQIAGVGAIVQLVVGLGYAVFVFLLYVAGSYLALRYRMARTRWRGVTFVQRGTVRGYLGLMLLGWFLCIVTLGFYLPWFQIKRARYVFNYLSFGSIPFRQTATAKGLLLRYFGVGLIIATTIGVAAVLWITLAPMALLNDVDAAFGPLLGVFAGALVVFLGYLFAVSVYRQKLTQNIAEGLSLGPLRFRFSATATQFFRLTLGNLLLTWLSLGLLYPLATHRTQTFWARHLSVLGAIDPAEIEQAALRPLGGEGLSGFLGDMDAGFG
jgi:uncharacterized membrane protein YjgN (DUF898 family)